MPTRNISLTAEQDAFVDKLVNAGEYQNASEALRDALRALEQRRREDSLKLKALRIQIKAGIDAIKRGDFADVEGANLEDYLERLTARVSAHAEQWRFFGWQGRHRPISPTFLRPAPSDGESKGGDATPSFSPQRCEQSPLIRKARSRAPERNCCREFAVFICGMRAAMLHSRR